MLRPHGVVPNTSGRAQYGQSFVELALTLPIMLMMVMGVVDLCFVLYAHVQVASATGEAARVAAHYQGDATLTTGANDSARLALVQNAVYDGTNGSLGLLRTNAPYFTLSNDVWIDGYDSSNPGGVTRSGEEMVVHLRYNQPVLFGILPGLNSMRFTAVNTARVRIP